MRRALVRAMYRLYIWAFSGSEDVFALSERVVEYPFAINALKRISAGSRVAVVGCHGDLLTTIVPTLGFNTYGLDIKNYPQQWSNFHFTECDIRRTGFDSDFFAAVLVVSTIEHVGLFDDDPDGDRKGMRELIRTLQPGGVLVLTVPFGASASVMPMRQRTYDLASLHALLDGVSIDDLWVRALVDGWWQPVEPHAAPPPSYPTHCVAMVSGRKVA